MFSLHDIETRLRSMTSIEGGIVEVLSTVSKEVKDQISASNLEGIHAVLSFIETKARELADAIVANTVAAPSTLTKAQPTQAGKENENQDASATRLEENKA